VINPWISYTLLRLGLFIAFFWGFLALGFNTYVAAIIAAGVSFAISLLFLDKQRNAMSQAVSKKLARNDKGSYDDAESDLENDIVDSETQTDEKDSKGDK
jgi:mannitol-specific phosphotransferase system IIBC component